MAAGTQLRFASRIGGILTFHVTGRSSHRILTRGGPFAFVGQLRQKVEADPGYPALIVTEPGVGYRLLPDAG